MPAIDGCDKTEYARALGYTGDKPVVVSGGCVISHRKIDWFTFCDRLRETAKKQQTEEKTCTV